MGEKTNQTITAHSLASIEYRLASSVWPASYIRGLIFHSSSGLTVAMSVVSGPAKIIGFDLYIAGPGTIIFAPNQEGNEHYNPAPEVTASWIISPSNWAVTPKRVLCIAVDFSDLPGPPVALDAVVSNLATKVSSYMEDNSSSRRAPTKAGSSLRK